ncbi:MAG: hypothetical protein ACKPKO_33595, partial [Candidatus Fonsibacter sp.]
YRTHKKGIGMRALQEDLLERLRFEATPSEQTQVQAAESYGHNSEVQSRPARNSASITLLKDIPHILVYT